MGLVLRWTTAGESHGRALVAVVEGMGAGLTVTSDDIADQLAPRPPGYGRGARRRLRRDRGPAPGGAAEPDGARHPPLTPPRPGPPHYAGMLKYEFDDARPVLERASA